MKTVRRGFVAGIVLLLSIFILASISQGQTAGKEIRIGLIVPKTGWATEEGMIEFHGAMIAVEEINAAGGIMGLPVNLIVYDNGSNSTQSINVAKKLIFEDKVLEIIGPAFSGDVEVTFPVANRAKTPCISPLSAKPGLSEKNRPWCFRNTLTTDKLYQPLIKRWAKDFNIKQVAIIYDAKDALAKADGSEVFPKVLEEAGITVLTSVSYMTSDIDYSAQLTKIQSINPQGIVVVPGARVDAAQIVRQAREKGMKQPITGNIELATPGFREIAGEHAEGVYMTHSFWTEGNPDPRMQAFMKKVKERTGRSASIGDTRTYDTFYMTKNIIENKKISNKPDDLEKDRDKIREGWQTLKDFKGIEGRTSMNEKGDGIKETYLFVVKGGKWTRLN